MAVVQTTWSPDTCGCRIVYEVDDAVAVPVYSAVAVERRCARHDTFLTNMVSHFDQVAFENSSKNKVLNHIDATYPGSFDADGNFVGSWSFDNGNALHVVTGFGRTRRNALQAWCDLEIGQGAVVIE